MEESRVKGLCEALDTLVNIDWQQRGMMPKFYPPSRRHYGDPLTYVAAKLLVDRVPRDDLVLLSGGNIVLPTYLGIGETDGPAGVAILARALQLGLNATPVILTEAKLVSGVAEVMRAGGFSVVGLDDLKRFRDDRFALLRGEMVSSVLPFPDEDEAALQVADRLLGDLHPSAIIAIEKIGRNEKGIYHSSLGTDMSKDMARVDLLVQVARRSGILTIGIGDGGNEIGFGVIKEDVKANRIWGNKCRCPCGAGIATVAETDALVTAEVSNWGAYAVSASLLSMLDKPESVHGRSIENRVLDATARAGFINLAREVSPFVDTFSPEVNCCIVDLMQELVKKAQFDQFNYRMKGPSETGP